MHKTKSGILVYKVMIVKGCLDYFQFHLKIKLLTS